MSKFKILVKHSYSQKIRAKSFILTTLLYVAVMTVAIFWSDIRDAFFKDEAIKITLINETDAAFDTIFVSTDDIEYVHESQRAASLDKDLEEGTLDAVLTIRDEAGSLHADIATYTPLKLNDQTAVSALLQYAGQQYAVQKLSLTPEEAAQLLASEPVVTMTNINEELAGGKSEEEKQAGMWTSYAIGILIYLFVASFLSMITTDVASEKGSRAMEMLLVSVKPGTHFRAKIVGVLLLAITQMAVLGGVFLALAKFAKDGVIWEVAGEVLQELSYGYAFYVVAFLFSTIILYLIVGALFGSLVSKVEEASQVMMPALMLTLVGFYVMLSGIGNPDTMLIKVFSFIPFTSGMVMPMRIGATDISAIEPVISLAILIGSLILLYVLSLSFYKRSVLTYSTGGIIAKIKTVLKVTT